MRPKEVMSVCGANRYSNGLSIMLVLIFPDNKGGVRLKVG
jgi:hypothetical protein